jgi:hypothetical protein
MKNLARILALTTLAFLALTPVAAKAAAPSLNVEPETVNRVTAGDDCAPVATDDCIHVLTATVTDAGVPQNGEEISFEFEGGPSDPDPGADPVLVPDATCTTAATPTPGSCQISFHSSTEGEDTVRAWIEDGTFPIGDEADTDEEQDEAVTPGDPAATEPDITDVVDVTWFDGTLNIEPEEGTFPLSTEVSFEATVLEEDPAGPDPAVPLVANVDAEIETGSVNANKNATSVDMECDTVATGKCTLKYDASATPGVDNIRGWIDQNDNGTRTTPPNGDETTGADYEADNTESLSAEGTGTGAPITDVVKANISANPVLQATPISQTKNINETATITASLTTGGVPDNAKKIAAVVLPGGPNAGKSLTCNTGTGGTCSVSYTGATNGTDKVRLWADTNGDGLPDEADTSEDFGTAGATPEPDTTAVVQVTWVTPTPDPDPDPGDNDACEQAQRDVKRAKKALKRAKASGNDNKIAKAKKRLKKAKKKRANACV